MGILIGMRLVVWFFRSYDDDDGNYWIMVTLEETARTYCHRGADDRDIYRGFGLVQGRTDQIGFTPAHF